MLNVLDRFADFNLEDDLLQHLSGSYAVAVMPRPNNLSSLNTPYDVLVVAETADGEAVMAGLTRAVQATLNLETLGNVTLDDFTFQAIPGRSSDDPALLMGMVDTMLVVGTGTSVEAALRARAGDNRLVSRPRWQSVSGDNAPHLYLDISPLYNTFLPQEGGPIVVGINQVSARTTYRGEGVYTVDMMVTLPGGIG
jgi:hypothetical protein